MVLSADIARPTSESGIAPSASGIAGTGIPLNGTAQLGVDTTLPRYEASATGEKASTAVPDSELTATAISVRAQQSTALVHSESVGFLSATIHILLEDGRAIGTSLAFSTSYGQTFRIERRNTNGELSIEQQAEARAHLQNILGGLPRLMAASLDAGTTEIGRLFTRELLNKGYSLVAESTQCSLLGLDAHAKLLGPGKSIPESMSELARAIFGHHTFDVSFTQYTGTVGQNSRISRAILRVDEQKRDLRFDFEFEPNANERGIKLGFSYQPQANESLNPQRHLLNFLQSKQFDKYLAQTLTHDSSCRVHRMEHLFLLDETASLVLRLAPAALVCDVDIKCAEGSIKGDNINLTQFRMSAEQGLKVFLRGGRMLQCSLGSEAGKVEGRIENVLFNTCSTSLAARLALKDNRYFGCAPSLKSKLGAIVAHTLNQKEPGALINKLTSLIAGIRSRYFAPQAPTDDILFWKEPQKGQ